MRTTELVKYFFLLFTLKFLSNKVGMEGEWLFHYSGDVHNKI